MEKVRRLAPLKGWVVEFSSSSWQLLNAAAHTAASIKRRLRRFAFINTHTTTAPPYHEWEKERGGEREEKARRSQTLSLADSWMFYHLSHCRDVFLGTPAQKFWATWPRALCIPIGIHQISSVVAFEETTPDGRRWLKRERLEWVRAVLFTPKTFLMCSSH